MCGEGRRGGSSAESWAAGAQELLSQPGCDVNQVNEDGFTPLHLALTYGQVRAQPPLTMDRRHQDVCTRELCSVSVAHVEMVGRASASCTRSQGGLRGENCRSTCCGRTRRAWVDCAERFLVHTLTVCGWVWVWRGAGGGGGSAVGRRARASERRRPHGPHAAAHRRAGGVRRTGDPPRGQR